MRTESYIRIGFIYRDPPTDPVIVKDKIYDSQDYLIGSLLVDLVVCMHTLLHTHMMVFDTDTELHIPTDKQIIGIVNMKENKH